MIISFLKDKFIKDSFIYLIGSLLVGVMGYAFHFLISRHLSVYEYGELQSLIAIYSILAILGSALSYLVVKYSSVIAKNRDYKSNREFIKFITSHTIRISFFIFACLVFTSPILFNFLNLNSFLGLFLIILASYIGLLSSVYMGNLAGWEDFLSLNISSVLGALTKLVFGFFIAVIFIKAHMVVIAILIASISSLLASYYLAKKRILSKNSTEIKKDWKEYFPNINFKKIIVPTFVFSSLIALILNFDVLLVKIFTSTEITGYFGALSIIGKAIFWINSIIIAIALPKIYSSNSKKSPWDVILKPYRIILSVGILGIIFCLFFSEYIVFVSFGQKYVEFSSLLWNFALMALLLSLLSLESNVAYASHKFKISYILAFTLFIMTLGVYLFHNDIKSIIWSINISFTFGYISAFIMNHVSIKPLNTKYKPEFNLFGTIIND
ncbi:MAG: hypothetical protein FJZ43_01685 [Candidatus Staskawiczbacteria bacterium]|nr:hypothetical protein [Candidatus Staskawiczbacteria bacterium]